MAWTSRIDILPVNRFICRQSSEKFFANRRKTLEKFTMTVYTMGE